MRHNERLWLSNTNLPWCDQEIWPEVTQGILFKGYMCLKWPLVSINKPVEMHFQTERMWHREMMSHVSRSHGIKGAILYGCSVWLSMRTGITRNHPWTLCSGQPSSLTCPTVSEENGDKCGTLARNRYKMASAENHSGEKYLSPHLATRFNLPNN